MRATAVAGSFYPFEKETLLKTIKRMVDSADTKICRDTFGFVSPHAGYIYSGWTAAYGFKSAKNIVDAETVIVIGPNHTGAGKPISISADEWVTPLGLVSTDKEFIKKMLDNRISVDESAHRYEHSIEVQLPFLQFYNPNAKIVPIVMKEQSFEAAMHIAKKITDAKESCQKDILVIASSDFSHFVPSDFAEKKDELLIERVRNLDTSGIFDIVALENITACGFGPMAVLTQYSKDMGCKEGVLLKYSNSGDVTGDYANVVGYASISMFKEI